MKYAGKKAGLMPQGADVESATEDKGENEVTESKKPMAKVAAMPKKKSGGLAAFMNRKMFGKSGK